jgi:hypothetical protein
MPPRQPLEFPKPPPIASQNPQEVIYIEEEEDILGDLDKVYILSPIKRK